MKRTWAVIHKAGSLFLAFLLCAQLLAAALPVYAGESDGEAAPEEELVLLAEGEGADTPAEEKEAPREPEGEDEPDLSALLELPKEPETSGEAEEPLPELPPFEGEGTEESPWLLKDAAALERLAADTTLGKDYTAGVFLLTEDVTLGSGWPGIGTADAPFAGVFDGGKHTVTLQPGEAKNSPVFGFAEGAVVRSLAVAGLLRSSAPALGALAAAAVDSLIEHCRVTARIEYIAPEPVPEEPAEDEPAEGEPENVSDEPAEGEPEQPEQPETPRIGALIGDARGSRIVSSFFYSSEQQLPLTGEGGEAESAYYLIVPAPAEEPADDMPADTQEETPAGETPPDEPEPETPAGESLDEGAAGKTPDGGEPAAESDEPAVRIGEGKDAEAFRSGEVTWLLNGGAAHGTFWANGEAFPVFGDAETPALYRLALARTADSYEGAELVFTQEEKTFATVYRPAGTELTLAARWSVEDPVRDDLILPEAIVWSEEKEDVLLCTVPETDLDLIYTFIDDPGLDWYLAAPEASEYTLYTSRQLYGFAALVNGTAEGEEGLLEDAFAGKTLTLGRSVRLDAVRCGQWTPAGAGEKHFDGVLDGAGFTVAA